MNASRVFVNEPRALDGGSRQAQPDAAKGPGVAGPNPRRWQAETAPVETTDQTLGSMVHAISNALNSVMSAAQLAQLLLGQRQVDETKFALARVEEECLRAARLLRDGRSLVTLKVPQSPGGADVALLLGACSAACAGLGEVRLECDTSLPTVHGQPDALKRMFVEFLDNAFQFGAHRVVIVAKEDDGGGAVRVEFRDDGPGIRDRSRALFESFVSSEPAVHSGLGLAFAAKIAATYGGAIGRDDSPNGAVFWVRLPFKAKPYPVSH